MKTREDLASSTAHGVVKAASIDTNGARALPDFFDVERYPDITFDSTTSINQICGGVNHRPVGGQGFVTSSG